MALSQRLEIKQTQSLAMTPQLRQAIALLQMSNAELTQHLHDEVEKNPLLELVEPEVEPPEPKPKDNETPRETSREAMPLPSSGTQSRADTFDVLSTIKSEQTLRENLFGQIKMSESNTRRADLACRLVDELDERGFLCAPLFEISERSGTAQAEMEDALILLQSCEPTGVGARDLKECLILQLVETDRMDQAMATLTEHLDILATGNLEKLAQLCALDSDELMRAIAVLKTLNPRPVSGFDVGIAQTAVPDVIVSPNPSGDWRVELNTNTLPMVLVNEQYAAEVSRDGTKAQEFVSECRANARFLIKAMDQRAKTILKVATVIVQHQNQFFDIGISGLVPLTLKAVASELGIHESTVSRVTSQKYLYSPRGNIELRFFFAQGLARHDGGPDIATPIVREKIRALIAAENSKKPLSDEKVTKIVYNSGVDVARRTIAKYREAMGIPSSSRRRRKHQKNTHT